MRKVMAALVSVVLIATALLVAAPAAPAGPSAGGLSSDNVEWLKNVVISQDAVGGRVVGKYFYANDQNKIMIFDVSDPVNPVLTDAYPLPQEWLFSREDLDTNGEILIMPNTVERSLLIFDVEDKSNIQLISRVPGGNQHTVSCVDNCRWAYGSDGMIVDLRNPAKPKRLERKWGDGMPTNGGHDVEEVAPGLVLTATQPILLLDTRNPADPKLLASGMNPDGRFIHTPRWPNNAKSDFLLMAGETNFKPRCAETNGAFMTWDARSWQKTGKFTMIDEYRMQNGTYTDGNPTVNQAGCSSHWHEASPKYKNNGGVVAAAFFEHGTRFIDVSSKGKIKEVGWFVPAVGSTGAVYWITDEILYAIDYNRGIDILRYTGKH